jgi:pantoate--beta-alanine ligase
MTVIDSVQKMQQISAGWSQHKVGFVPTMGALHQGHRALLDRARSENEIVVLSIFVNPTQFNDTKDFEKYPKTLTADLEIAAASKIDLVFLPNSIQMYPDQYQYKVLENNLSQKFCGAFRPGHFEGMLTVVMKLFNIVRPTSAYFGEKDFQQLLLVKKMTEAFFMPINIIPVKTVRAENGLALSSRNSRLTDEGLIRAGQLNLILRSENDLRKIKYHLAKLGFEVEYVQDLENRRLAAVWIDGVRLIDNVEI